MQLTASRYLLTKKNQVLTINNVCMYLLSWSFVYLFQYLEFSKIGIINLCKIKIIKIFSISHGYCISNFIFRELVSEIVNS